MYIYIYSNVKFSIFKLIVKTSDVTVNIVITVKSFKTKFIYSELMS